MSKNVALFFDGTWNRPQEDGRTEADTNVRKLFVAAEQSDRQVARYICGVGTSGGRVRRALGGSGGLGISANIQKGYEKLVKYFKDRDHLYLFGFSRGAYTARSLAGFLEYVGLLMESHIADVPKAFEIYKSRANVEDSDLLPFLRRLLGKPNLEFAPLPVYLIGVWDTVGRLGIPGPLGVISHPLVRFHRTDVPPNVTHARHALALHELRPQFDPVPWTSHTASTKTLEQVWFAGAHCDVGGGYTDARLSDIALGWMASEAMHPDGAASGLLVDESLLRLQPDPLAPVQHELKQWFAFNRSHVRSAVKQRPVLDTLHLDGSARRRCWDPGRAAHTAWRPDVKRALDRVDRHTLQLDLWMRYNRPPSPSVAKPWWATLRPEHIADVVTSAGQIAAAGSGADGPPATLTIRAGQSLAESLCVLFLYGGADAVRALIASCDRRFTRALQYDDATLRRDAGAWQPQLTLYNDGRKEAKHLLPPGLVDAYTASAFVRDTDGLDAAHRLYIWISGLKPPIRVPKAGTTRT